MSPTRRRAAPPIVRHVAALLAATLAVTLAACSGSATNDSVTFVFDDADCDLVEDGPGITPGAMGDDDVFDDRDGDGVGDRCDDCPDLANGPTAGPNDQRDTDGDGLGNACDGDDDGDRVVDASDNCPLAPNPTQVATDGDSDGIPDACDACPTTPGALHAVRTDCNGDGDTSDPGEGVGEQCDQDFDRTGDPCDADEDGDGLADATDNCPDVSNPVHLVPTDCNDDGDRSDPGEAVGAQCDRDGDGVGDACDDSDGDGVSDANDNCVSAPNPANAFATDCNGDGDRVDPGESSGAQCDVDGDGRGDACDGGG
jgi:hypothetical protein